MQDSSSEPKNRWFVWLGAGSALLMVGALVEVAFAPSFLYGAIAAAAALLAFGVLVLVVRRPNRYPGAPTSTQLQQPPPGIIERLPDDT